MKTLLRFIILVPLACLLVWIAAANQHMVQLSLDPIQSLNPAIAFALPLHSVIFASLALGILFGGLWTWIGQGRHRKRARLQSRAAARWHDKAQRAEAKLEQLVTDPDPGPVEEPVSRQTETKRAIALLADEGP